MRSKLYTYVIRAFWSAFIAGLIYLYFVKQRLEKEQEELCDRGFGNTSLELKVLDFNSDKIIDSVRLTIRYGMSADRIIDTTLRQEESINYNFYVSELNDCDSYWYELSNDLYWNAIYFKDTTQRYSIKKGTHNKTTLYLKPSTKIKATVLNDMTNLMEDSVALQIEQKNGKENGKWTYFSRNDLNQIKLKTKFLSLESDVDYEARWIHMSAALTDTTVVEFHTLPFDTLELNYRLPQPKPNH